MFLLDDAHLASVGQGLARDNQFMLMEKITMVSLQSMESHHMG
jgi:hypothetical protein